jgi:hypothetical protein
MGVAIWVGGFALTLTDKRQKNQLKLAFTEEGRSEAPRAPREGIESSTAKYESEKSGKSSTT